MFGLPEALMSFIRRQVGLRTDAADATGSLHAKVSDLTDKADQLLSNEIRSMSVASDNLMASSDQQTTIRNRTVLTKAKEFVVLYTGYVRVSFVIWEGRYDGGSAQIYVNGSAVGTSRSSDEAEVTYTEDIFVYAEDRVQLYASTQSSGSNDRVFIKDFRVYFDLVPAKAIETYHTSLIVD